MRTPLVLALALPLVACTTETSSESVQAASSEPHASSAPPAMDETSPTTEPAVEPTSGFYALDASPLDDVPADLGEYAGQVTLVVNVASRCGYTRQYAGLQELHTELEGRGFAVLAFPSNEFGGQEPGSPAEIREFCTSEFGVSFPMFAKCEVKPGAGQSPVYGFLQQETGEVPGWNFCKYLIGRDGQVIGFYESSVAPDDAELRQAIETALG